MFSSLDFFPNWLSLSGTSHLENCLKFGHRGKHLWQKKRLSAWFGHHVPGQNKPVQRIEALEARHRPQHIHAQQESDVQAGGVMVKTVAATGTSNLGIYFLGWCETFLVPR